VVTSQPPAGEPEAALSGRDAQALLPYGQASPFQRAQSLRSARSILDAAYPFLGPTQWYQALDFLQLPLHVNGGQTTFLPDGLATLVHFLEAQYRPRSAAGLPGFPATVPSDSTLLAAEPTTKQTYAIRNSLVEQLARVSYWRRQPQTSFINLALTQLLSQYQEANMPLPEPEE
jgi:hypothetical protein